MWQKQEENKSTRLRVLLSIITMLLTLLINYLLFTFIQVICLSVPALILPIFVRCLMVKTMAMIVIKIA